ncbi:hydrogenase formation protein HypD [Phaeobacter gallaeciensis]|uniref:hydrogenase formation protein HypD n=1 Tax=Phaeobacter gallaeciensis TaxID=60890 RepID=UPI00237F5D84|nr:hydrogenase formation protein HypD [Phaeobacter gallaeciensis]MDE4099992.1 hydrogenase formation protein HypD [Phaeobacter gallaeciensis]MDE4108816.1 hydrogenase formation protein HypD [Phaeobacter gallaeciensis]MDE4113262.1 hydrogenase formation protein HypD [Phaeobacter gallaeciensis]MDE4117703.1 hydrogenase formation protein HypD [Phaeobacter gallaeciensis]MDE4122206.1 hydrogenase formation protein HypD [Phaeobacter gallaeciensis]
MRYVEEFRDPVAARGVLRAITEIVDEIGATREKPVHIMEICGGHTHAIFRYGLDRLTPAGIEFIHGPGCPVCVLPMSRIDECVEIAERAQVIFTTFGDAMRVPGTRKSLMQAKADGADIRMVYSPLDALEIARRNPDREVVFFGLGFETTTPSTALTIQQAAREGTGNFSVFCNHITVPPPIKALLDDPHMVLDGFVGPGHVSMVIGTHPYDFIARDCGKPIVVAGFEPLDLLQSVLMVLEQIRDGRAEVENQYARVVPEHGNAVSLAAIADVYEPRPTFEWRGLGEIDASGLRIRDAYSAFDAEEKFGVGYGAGPRTVAEPEGCACGQVMTGRIKPTGCPQYGTGCTPEMPLGALMVSSEGACAAYYQYGATEAESVEAAD